MRPPCVCPTPPWFAAKTPPCHPLIVLSVSALTSAILGLVGAAAACECECFSYHFILLTILVPDNLPVNYYLWCAIAATVAGTLDILAKTRKELEEWDSGIIVIRSDVASSLLPLRGFTG